MILQALVQHYDRLAADPDSDIAAYGFTPQAVSFAVVIEPGGNLHAIEPLIDDTSGKPQPIELVVPGYDKPSGGVTAKSVHKKCRFLCNDAMYMLGYAENTSDRKKAQMCFEAFRNRHLELEERMDNHAFSAVCGFLKNWVPGAGLTGQHEDALKGARLGVFRLRGQTGYIHDVPVVKKFWEAFGDAIDSKGAVDAKQLEQFYEQQASSEKQQCLVTGQRSIIVKTHRPKIKGVWGGQPSGALLVSFNEDAYLSNGKPQSVNAPTSQEAAFRYATALNRLLAGRKHRVQLGDTTCVFWTDKPETGATDALADALDDYWASNTTSDETAEAEAGNALRDFLNRFRQGKADPTSKDLESANAPFYVLGLAPNASRISIRFWMQCTVAQLADRLNQHAQRTAVFDSRSQEIFQPTLRQLLRETGRETKDIPPQLAGELARAVLQNLKYPAALAVNILRRIKADQAKDKHPAVNPARAAGLRAWLIRNHEMEVPVSLDPERTDPPYLLGRLFAAYEKVQQEASGGGLNRTIRDSYLSAASATPASVFPRLYRLNQHHFNKLRREKPGLAVVRERLIGAICQGLTDFPRHLPLHAQGLFAIGYYHQTHDFYTKREPQNESLETVATTSEEE